MKGIILAGGSGTRLYPITKATSKQLLPLYDKPMIYYSLSTLLLADIRDILIITTKENKQAYIDVLGNGSHFGIKLSYEVQDKPNGLAESFIIGEKFIGDSNVALMLGDNFFYGQSFSKQLLKMKNYVSINGGGAIFGTYVNDPSAYGVVDFDDLGNVISIEEKPKVFKSNYAVPGLYFFDNKVIEHAKKVGFSKRGELEITSVIEKYISGKKLKIELLGRGLSWLDTGTHEDLSDAVEFVRTIQKRQGLLVGSPEEIGFSKGWITSEQLIENTKDLQKNEYGIYLKKLAMGELNVY